MRRYLSLPGTLRRLALASLVANVVIVVTGGAVRLTGSGLGCPTWPQCGPGSLVARPAMGVHGAIEFGNRTLAGLVAAVALAALVAAVSQRRQVGTASVVVGGIVAQGVVGGLTVLTGLNAWLVAGHFLLSMAVLAAAFRLWARTRPPGPPVPRALAWATTAASAAVLTAGTVVTGSGPHAGDAHVPRTGLDPAQVAQVHADLVFLLLGLSVALWLVTRARSAALLVAAELAQGVVGFTQYFTHLPALVVGLHLAGACLVWLATLAVLDAALRRPPPQTEPAPAATVRDPAVARRA